MLLLIIAVLALIGIKTLKQVQPKPVQAINDAQATVTTLKASLKPAAGTETSQA